MEDMVAVNTHSAGASGATWVGAMAQLRRVDHVIVDQERYREAQKVFRGVLLHRDL